MYEINKKILNDLNFEGKQQFLRKLERINMKVLVIKSLRWKWKFYYNMFFNVYNIFNEETNHRKV